MKEFFNRPWVYRVLSLGLAALLFAWVTSQNLGATRSNSQTPEQTAVADITETLKTTLQVDSDQDTYYVTGYPKQVSITLAGPSANVIAARNMRNFRVYIDVRDLKVGTHTVKIKQTGLNRSLKYTIKPETVKVKIATRSDKTFPIQANYKTSRIAEGYLTGTPSISPATVRVSGAKSEVSRVSEVVAQLDISNNTKDNYEQEVLLEALDKNGDAVDVLLTPQTVHVSLPVYLPSKKVKLNFEQSGSGDDGRVYSFVSSVTQVTLFAPQSVLDDIGKSITVPVSVSKVNSSIQKTIKIYKPNGVVEIDPSAVTVNIQVTQVNAESNNTTSSSSSRSTSSSEESSSDEDSDSDEKSSSSSQSSSSSTSKSSSSSDSE
ncbi:YbbR-like domain-containing protein [Lapidilactobacillus mulanensis]|uniref:YbbR-like domain-containing protein n=1 Tax=Lapidilactobacillus mulanensis TaxID=2485999 RepID=A0ABW4DNC6_9LACO|nr:CdaR family protein [Lapidilactobacillus mulanensis]